MSIVEICINTDNPQQTITEAIAAASEGGARRIELCAAMQHEGLTPDQAQIAEAVSAFPRDMQLLVMIRPQPGGFAVDNKTLHLMQTQIEHAANVGAAGVVFGVLTADNSIDLEKNQTLIALCQSLNLKTTFHRAVDATGDPLLSLKQIIDLGFDRVLSSGTSWGAYQGALQGVTVIHDMLIESNGSIEVVIGGGINAISKKRISKQLGTMAEKASWHAYSGVMKAGIVTAAAVNSLVND